MIALKKTLPLVSLCMLLPALLAETCLDCHDDPELTLERDGREISLYASAAQFAGTPHEDFACLDCHAGLDEDELPHADPIPPAVVGCLDCHDDLAATHAFRPKLAELDEPSVLEEGVRCSDCHGTHTIAAVDAPGFPFGPATQTSRCGRCHEAESMAFLHSAHANALEAGEEFAPTCMGCHKHDRMHDPAGCDPAEHKVHLVELCIQCHVDDPQVAGKTHYGTPFLTSFADSVHGKALYEGNADAPGCVDCHGSHHVARAMDATSNVNRVQVVSQCSKCHEQAAEDYLHSIHAQVLSMGYKDAPVCTDCHGEHHILKHTDPDSPVAAMNLAEQVCGDCHGSVKLAQRYGLETDRLSTFEESYHGLATRGGSVEAVNCASCHGYHDVRTCDDPESWVHPDNLAKTCGHCHEGANERFAVGKMHVSLDPGSEDPVLHWVATIYVWGIFIVIGGMLFHNGLDLLKKIRIKAKRHWSREEIMIHSLPHRLYVRMTLNERLQHGLMVVSFVVLVITGFMLRYPDAWWVEGLRNLNGNLFEWRSLIHRVAGVLMCAAGAWHIGYLSFTRPGRQLFKDIFPKWSDLSDMKGVLLYNIGLAKSKPRFGRFSYIEKAEYWALIWGSVIMTLTGFMLWFENATIGYLTKLGFDIGRTVHFYEAILATLAIIVWHFYFVIFNPDVYPMNLAWLTGKMTEEEMAHEHPRELERLKAEREASQGSSESTEKN